MENPYTKLVEAGCQIDSHESDLYVRATPEAQKIVNESGWRRGEPFISDDMMWLEVPFAYSPFWEGKS